MFPCPRSRLRIWSRETGSAVPSRVSLLISILRLNLVLTYGIPPEFRGGVHLFILNRHTPSGESRVYRVTHLRTDGVHYRQHTASKPQGSSERVLPWQVTINQLICASLTPTVGMKLPRETKFSGASEDHILLCVAFVVLALVFLSGLSSAAYRAAFLA